MKRKRKAQVNIVLEDAVDDLLNAAAQDLGLTRSAIASEVFALAFPLYLEIARQQKSNERELMARALEIALGKSPAVEPQHPSMARPARRRGGR